MKRWTERGRRGLPACGWVLWLSVLASCGTAGPGSGSAGHPSMAVLGVGGDVDAWNEYLARQSFSVAVLRRLYPPLVWERPGDGGAPRYAPALATSWTLSEDGRRVTFHLRDAVWSDGRAVTAEDVRFTWRAQTSEAVAWAGRSSKARILDVRVVDPSTVVFEFDGPYPDQIGDAADGGILPAHVFGAVPFEEWRSHDWSRHRVVSGPFALAGHRPGEEIDLERNPRFYGASSVHLDRVVFRIAPDPTARKTQLLAGELDFSDGFAPWDADTLHRAPGIRVLPYPVLGYDYIGWNHRRPPFGDPRVRRALTLAIDRRAIVEDLLHGYGRVCSGPVPSSSWAHPGDLPPAPHDPAEALRLFQAAGLRWDPAAGRLLHEGRPFAVTLLVNAGNRLRESVALRVQQDLASVGIEVSIRPLEMKAFVSRNMAGDFDAYLGGWRLSRRIELEPLFASSAQPPGGFNVVGYRNDAVDRLLSELRQAADRDAARSILRKIAVIMLEDPPYTFLYEPQRIAGAGSRLEGVRIPDPADPYAFLEWTRVSAP